MKRFLAPAAALGLLLIAWQVHAGIGKFLFRGACITNCGGGGGGGGGAVVATNDFYMPATGGTPPGSVVPYSFGQAFRSGDVPAGNSVSVTDNQGHPLTYQIDSISPAWPDGSWRYVVITAFVPATAGNVQQRLKLVLNPQAYAPASTPRSIAEISAHNYLIKYDNVKTHPAGTYCGSVGCNPNGYTWSTKGSHSGNFTCNIDNFIAAGQYKIRKNGPVVLEALVYGQATDDGGGTDPHLYCRDWIDVYSDPNNPNGTGAGHILYTEHMPLLQQPIADPADGSTLPGTGGNDANADFVIGQASYYDGATKIRDFADDTINLTSAAIVPANGRSGYITTSLPHMAARSGYMVHNVCGTLPAGLSNGLIGFAWAPFGASNFTLRPDIYTNNDNYYNVTDSGNGSGCGGTAVVTAVTLTNGPPNIAYAAAGSCTTATCTWIQPGISGEAVSDVYADMTPMSANYTGTFSLSGPGSGNYSISTSADSAGRNVGHITLNATGAASGAGDDDVTVTAGGISQRLTIHKASGTAVACGTDATIQAAANTNATVLRLAPNCTYTMSNTVAAAVNGQIFLGAGCSMRVCSTKLDGGTNNLAAGVIGYNGQSVGLNVAIMNLAVQNVGVTDTNKENSPGNSGLQTTEGWVLRNNVIQNNGMVGVYHHGGGQSVLNNTFINNGYDADKRTIDTFGPTGTTGTGTFTYAGNEEDNNASGLFDVCFDSGNKFNPGSKGVTANIYNNYYHDGHANYDWWDFNTNMTFNVHDNTFLRGGFHGVMSEVSAPDHSVQTNIYNNYFSHMGDGTTTYFNQSACGGVTNNNNAIFGGGTTNVNAHDNNFSLYDVLGPGSAAQYDSQDWRSDASPDQQNLRFDNNTVNFHTTNSGSLIAWGNLSCNPTCITSKSEAGSGGNGNSYHLPGGNTSTDAHWRWATQSAATNFATFKTASGQDSTSTIDTTAVDGAGCTHVACSGAGIGAGGAPLANGSATADTLQLIPLQYMAYYNGFFITQASDTNDGLAVPLQQAGTWTPPAEWMVQPNLDGTTNDKSTASQKAYWQSTGLIPGWDLSLGASVQSLNANMQWTVDITPWYDAGSNGPYRTGIDAGSGSLDTDGPWAEWVSNDFMRMGATNWSPSDFLILWNAELFTAALPNTQIERLPGTGGTTATDPPRIIPWDTGSGDPAALGTASPNDVWYAKNCTFSGGSCVNNAFVFPANLLSGTLPQWFYGSYGSGFTNYHWPPSGIIGYLLFGRDYINYLERGTAQRALLQEAGYQNINIGGTNYQRVTQICSPNGEIIPLPFAAGLLGPASDPEVTYFRNYINRQNSMVTAFYNAEDASKHAAGACLSQGNAEGFNTSYTYLGYAWSFAASRLDGIDLMMRDWATWLAGQSDVPGPPATANGVGTWGVAASVVGAGYYNSIIGGWSMNTTGIAPNPTKYHGSNAVGLGGSDAISVATNGVFSYGPNWVALGNLFNGDEFIAAADGAGTYSGPPELGPPNFPELTTFYLINVNQTAQTFQLTSNCTTFTGTHCTTPDPAHIISTFSQAWGGCDGCWWNLRPKHDTGGTTSDAAFTYTLLPKASMAEFIRDGIPTNPTYNPNLTQAFNVLNARLPSSSVSSITGSPFYSRISQVTTVPIVPTPPQSVVVAGDPAAGLLPADRDAYANWKMAGLQSLGGIPNRTTQCGSTLTPLGGGADDTSQIQTAINNCPSGQFVNLSAGTFTVAVNKTIYLNKSITLRGNGAGNTFVQKPTDNPPGPSTTITCPPSSTAAANYGCFQGNTSDSGEIVRMSPFPNNVGNTLTACALTADTHFGDVSLTVTSGCASNFHVGDIVNLDENVGVQWMPDTAADNGSNAQAVCANDDYRIVYQIQLRANGTTYGDDSTCPPTNNSGVYGAYSLNPNRLTNELKRVSAVSGSTITFDSPIMQNYRVSHTADLWYMATQPVSQAGLENMTVRNGGTPVQMYFCQYCWIRGLNISNGLGDIIAVWATFRSNVTHTYVHECAWPEPGEVCYNLEMKYNSSENLWDDNISVLANKVVANQGGGAGNVFAYNYLDAGYIEGSCCWQEIGANASHLTGPHHDLFEGNLTFNMDSDFTHGASNFVTFFRNWSTAIRRSFQGMTQGQGATTRTFTTWNDAANTCGTTAYSGSPLRAAAMQGHSYWFSFIGNMLGTPGCTDAAHGFPLNNKFGGPQNSDGIFFLGWANFGTQNNDAIDQTIYPNTPPTIACSTGVSCAVPSASCTTYGSNCSTILIGNYDTVHAAQCNGPASVAAPTPCQTTSPPTLPNSFYLTGTPGFFGSNTWPWVTPSNGTTATLPAKSRYDSNNCATAVFQNGADCEPF